jgi:hypothetical protein
MIFYGTNSSKLKEGRLNNVNCPNCESQTTMNYAIFGKYFYIYWIPFFPIGKENILECSSCNKTYKIKELPEQIKKKFELEKHKNIPFLHFSGLAIVACLISYFSYSSSKEKELEYDYIKAPAIGDVYSVTSETKGHYTTMKIKNITQDSVFLVPNTYEINKKIATNDIDKNENYTDSELGYSKKEIVSLYSDNIIYQVNRNK